jgi:uncharacterized protein
VNVRELLRAVAHRPYPLPPGPWLMTQVWHDLLFAHWPVAPALLAPHLPTGLSLDTFEGQAYLAVVPFHMSEIKLRGALGVPGATRFPELNVRTYAVRDGRPGVWFFSLDAGSALAVEGARRFFHLPYLHAAMAAQEEGGWIAYESRRTDGRAQPAVFRGRYRPVGGVRPAVPGTLEHWLTERYCLYTADRRGRLLRGEIHHEPWPLQAAEADIRENSMAAGLRPAGPPPLLHFARRLDVLVWSLQAVGRSDGE